MQWRGDAPAAATTPESEGSQALACTSSPVHQTETPPFPILPMSDSPNWQPPVRHSLVKFLIDPQYTKWDCFSSGAPDDRPGKKAHTETTETDVSSGHSTPQGNGELPKTLPEAPNNGVGASWSAEEHNSKDNTNHCGDELTKTSHGWMQPPLIWNQLLGIASLVQTQRRWLLKMHERGSRRGVQASCSIARSCLWFEAQIKQKKDSCQAIWESNHEMIQT